MTIYGYARVSTQDQKLNRQLDALRDYGVECLYTDKLSGKDFNRPGYKKLMRRLREGDLLVIPSVAIHFDRAANDGVKYRANVDTLPLAGSDGAADILTLAAESAGLRPEDVLVINHTRVIPARLYGERAGGGVCGLLRAVIADAFWCSS